MQTNKARRKERETQTTPGAGGQGSVKYPLKPD